MNQFEIRRGTGEEKYFEQLGRAAMLMCQSSAYRLFRLATLEMWIEPAIRHRQIAFIVDHLDNTVGYLTWALLAPDVEKRLLEQRTFRMHESEWDEGRKLWIMDFVAPCGNVPSIVTCLREHCFPGHSEAHAVRRDEQGTVRKTSLWIRRSPKEERGKAGMHTA